MWQECGGIGLEASRDAKVTNVCCGSSRPVGNQCSDWLRPTATSIQNRSILGGLGQYGRCQRLATFYSTSVD